MRSVVVITGPTATGKTELGIRLALMYGGEIVSADSMQLYKRMDIGTAKPTAEEMRGVTHHMIDVVDPKESYSVARYVEDAGKCVEDILNRGKLPIVVGGTGLYIESLLSGRSFAEGEQDSKLRKELSERYDAEGGRKMLAELFECDPKAAERLHENDKKRIVRALEVFLSSGETITAHNEKTKKIPPRYDACKIALNFRERTQLYKRINLRVDKMFELGLAGEVEELLADGIDEKYTSMQAIGYKEVVAALRGECTLEMAAEVVKRESRRYAKRQLSWLRRDKQINWILWDEQPDYEKACQNSTWFLEKSGIIN